MTPRAAAGRYARALFDVIVKRRDPADVDRELATFAELVTGHEGLSKVVGNPAVPISSKRAIVQALIDRLKPSPEIALLLLLLADRDRLALIGHIAEAYHARLLDHQGVVRAEVTTAVPLDDKRRAVLEASLARATGRTVQLTTRVDAEIIGGAVARVGSVVYDGSVTRQLERIKDTLAEA
jgi:F-type H+-transporting ATPase subunit delta